MTQGKALCMMFVQKNTN